MVFLSIEQGYTEQIRKKTIWEESKRYLELKQDIIEQGYWTRVLNKGIEQGIERGIERDIHEYLFNTKTFWLTAT